MRDTKLCAPAIRPVRNWDAIIGWHTSFRRAKCLSSNILHGICQAAAGRQISPEVSDDVVHFGLTHRAATRRQQQHRDGDTTASCELRVCACELLFVPRRRCSASVFPSPVHVGTAYRLWPCAKAAAGCTCAGRTFH